MTVKETIFRCRREITYLDADTTRRKYPEHIFISSVIAHSQDKIILSVFKPAQHFTSLVKSGGLTSTILFPGTICRFNLEQGPIKALISCCALSSASQTSTLR